MLKALAAVTLLVAQQAVTPAIPPGVRYKAASPELSEKARSLLAVAFGPDGKRFGDSSLYGSVVTCGPILWKGVQATGAITEQEKSRTTFMVAGPDGKPVPMAARRFFANDLAEFKKAMNSVAPPGPYSVRAPSGAELQFYWGMIPYDITAPIFTVEGAGRRFLVDFFGSDHAFLIEDVTDVAKGK